MARKRCLVKMGKTESEKIITTAKNVYNYLLTLVLKTHN